MAKTTTPARRRPNSKLTLLLLLIMLIGIGLQIYHLQEQIREAAEQKAAYSQRLEELQTRNQELSDDIANSDDPELMMRIARESLGMVGPGEKVMITGG